MNSINPAVISGEFSLIPTFLASFLIWLGVIVLVLIWLFSDKINREIVYHATLSMFITWIAVELFKRLGSTFRPFQINGQPPLTLTTPFDPGFPSAHAAISFALASSLLLHDKKLGVIYLVLAILVSYGRLATNVHYVVDVAGGFVLGVLVALILEGIHLGKFHHSHKNIRVDN